MYRCTHCDSTFANLHELTCHKRRRHTKERKDKATILYNDRSGQSAAMRDTEEEEVEDEIVAEEEPVAVVQEG